MRDFIEAESFPTGRGSYNELHDAVSEIMARPELHGKVLCIGHYPEDESGKGQAAVNSLRQKYGFREDVTGNTFSAGKVVVDGVDRRGVWVRHDPSKVVDGAKAAHDAKMLAASQKQAEAKKAKDAKAKREAEKAAKAAKVA